MIPQGNTFTAIWGRIGTSGASCSYPICQWDAKYAEKLSKGYSDESETVLENASDKQNLEESVRELNDFKITEGISLMARLASFAKSFIRRNYVTRYSVIKVNTSMIAKVDELIRQLSLQINASCSVESFNETLSRIFMAIPRVMNDTRYFYASSPADYSRIIKREADFIDSLRGMAKTADADRRQSISVDEGREYVNAHDVISRYDLKINPVTDSQKNDIIRHMGSNASRYVRAWRIENGITKKAFDKYRKALGDDANVKQLWHGSRTENFHSILCSGLLLNPNAVITGKMFGYGIYFAPSFAKSMGYTSLSGSVWANGNSDTAYMAVFDVALGKSLDVHSYNASYSSWKEKDILGTGCRSLWAHKGSMLHNDEVIVYNESAVTIRYLVEVRA